LTIGRVGVSGGAPLSWTMAEVRDVDGDSKADLVWRNNTNGMVAIWLMNGLTITSVGFPGSSSTDWEIQ